MAGHVIDVAAGSDSDATNLRREGVAQVIAVQVRRCDDVEIFRARQHLLQRDVGDRILNDEACSRLAFGNLAPRAAINFNRAVELLGNAITPVTEGAFRELHDVPLVNDRHAFAFVLDGVADGAVNQPLAAKTVSYTHLTLP